MEVLEGQGKQCILIDWLAFTVSSKGGKWDINIGKKGVERCFKCS